MELQRNVGAKIRKSKRYTMKVSEICK